MSDPASAATDVSIDSADGTRLAASRVGSGSAVVLVHGALLGREAWQFVVPHLATRHSVWTYDRRGHGRSGSGPDQRLDLEVDDVRAVVDAVGSDVHLIGHSFGGLLCLEAARDLPDLRSLVVYEPTLHFDRCEGALRRAVDLLNRDLIDDFLSVFLTDIAAVAPDEMTLLRSIPEGWGQLLDAARNYRDLGAAFSDAVDALLAMRWTPRRYSSISTPTLLVTGALSTSPLFATADDLRAAILHSSVAVLDGQRHMATVFDPAALVGAVSAFTSLHGGSINTS